MLAKVAKPLLHTISGSRKFYYSQLSLLAQSSKQSKILEIGSGKQVKGKEAYSAKHIFKDAKEFRQTDINPEYGHEVLDITTMKIKDEYDLILCLNVLEHVYETEAALANLRAALTKKGKLVVAVPFAFPLHDEPHDYWRFTQHALKRLLADFSKVEIKTNGPRKLPYGYFVIATK